MMVSLNAISTTVVISEFRVRGPSGGNDEFIELHNLSGSPVDIGGWKINGSNNAGTVSTRLTVTAGVVLNPGCFFLATNSGASGYSGSVAGNQTYSTGVTDDGGIALLRADNSIVDQVGLSTGSAYKEGTPLASLGTTNADRGYERKPGGTQGFVDTDNNATDFQVLTPSNPQNSSSPCLGTGTLNIAGAATPNPVIQFDNVRITGTVTPGANPASGSFTVTANLTNLGGSATQALFDDGSNGDVTANDKVYSFSLPVSASAGARSVTVKVADDQQRSDDDTFNVVVQAPPTIYLPHDIQGPGLTSPFNNTSVTVEGVVTGRRSNGVFIQTAPGHEDDNPQTSEGLFVFTSSAPPAGATVGTLVRATGTVAEFNGDGNGFTQTELAAPTFVFLGPSQLPTPTTLTAAMLSPSGGFNQLEPVENMLVFIPSLTTVSGTQGTFLAATGGEAAGISTSTGVFYAVLTGTPRPVREPGLDLPLAATFANQCASGPPCNIPVFDSNPERLRIDSDAIGGPVFDVTSGVTIQNMTGIIDSGFLGNGLLPTPASPGTVGPNALPVAVGAAGPTQFTIASFNMQRFFDTTNDPNTPSDVALTPANYAARLAKASLIVRTALHMPDVLAVQEVENLATLQDVANKVNGDASLPGEYTAYLEEGNDVGGIDVGFLVRKRVHAASVVQEGKDATFIDPTDGSVDLLNDRPPLILRGTVDGPANRLDAKIIVVANHLRSLNDVEIDARVRAKRQKQAEYLATLLNSLENEGAVVSVGDYNAFEFNDGLVDVFGTVLGQPVPPDQVVVASPDLVSPNYTEAAPGVYSYVFDGNTQTLDHVIMSPAAVDLFDGLQHARINADFPEVDRNDPTRVERLSDHDPAVAFFEFPLDTVPPTVAATPSVAALGAPNHKLVPIEISIESSDNLGVAECHVASVSSNEPQNGTGDGNTAIDWIIDGPTSVLLRAERAGTGSGRIYTITVACTDVAGNIGTTTTAVTVSGGKK